MPRLDPDGPIRLGAVFGPNLLPRMQRIWNRFQPVLSGRL